MAQRVARRLRRRHIYLPVYHPRDGLNYQDRREGTIASAIASNGNKIMLVRALDVNFNCRGSVESM